MTSSTSDSDRRPAWRRWLIVFCGVYFGAGALLFALLLLIDPYDTGRFPSFGIVGIDDRSMRTADASRARAHTSGQALSEAIYAEMPEVGGILFNSRLTTGACVAVYDRAFSVLSGTLPIDLLQSALLPPELKRLGITVRRRRGFTIL